MKEAKCWPHRTVSACNKGNTAIVVDDSCYVVKNWSGSEWGTSAWIFPEALQRIKQLPDNPNDAEDIVQTTPEDREKTLTIGGTKYEVPEEVIDLIQSISLERDELIDFAIWMTGCGYDFCQHDYFCKMRDRLLTNPCPD